jgi:hypothetical protein
MPPAKWNPSTRQWEYGTDGGGHVLGERAALTKASYEYRRAGFRREVMNDTEVYTKPLAPVVPLPAPEPKPSSSRRWSWGVFVRVRS